MIIIYNDRCNPIITVNTLYTVIITSSIISNLYNSTSPEQRFKETVRTVKSVREKIPNCTIILIESSKYDINALESLGVDHIISFMNLTDKVPDLRKKSHGELYTTKRALELIEYDGLLFKISGRYYLNDEFEVFSFPLDKCSFLTVYEYMRKFFNTLTPLYAISSKYKNLFLESLKSPLDEPDLECYVYKHFVRDTSVEEITPIFLIDN